MNIIERKITDELYKRYTQDSAMDKARFWQAVNQLRIETQQYYGGEIKISRAWAMPDKWTFRIKPIKNLLYKYKVGKGWIDPFAGENSPAEITNDIDENKKTTYHLDALKFMEMLPDESADGVLLDPPYNEHQAVTTYKNKKLRKITPLYEHARRILKSGGYLITFGWHSNGAGFERGFKKTEILLVPHGGERNDTIVVVEQKIQSELFYQYEQEIQ